MSATQDAPDAELPTPSETTPVSLSTYFEIADYLNRLFRDFVHRPFNQERSISREYRNHCVRQCVPAINPNQGEDIVWYKNEANSIARFDDMLKDKTGNKEAAKDLLELIIGMAFETHTVVIARAREHDWDDGWVDCAERFWMLARLARSELSSVTGPEA